VVDDLRERVAGAEGFGSDQEGELSLQPWLERRQGPVGPQPGDALLVGRVAKGARNCSE
jgi:hypothetical protein